MGIFESLKRMANGEPVFQQHDDQKGWVGGNGQPRETQQPAQPGQAGEQVAAAEPKTSVVKGSPSTYPMVVVKRTRVTQSGSNQTVYCSVVNRFTEPVEVEEIELAGDSRNLGGYLRPGEEREYMVFNGPRSKYEGHKEAKLNFKVDETGDYFQSVYDVEYQFEQHDQTYSIEELHFRGPIRDIFG